MTSFLTAYLYLFIQVSKSVVLPWQQVFTQSVTVGRKVDCYSVRVQPRLIGWDRGQKQNKAVNSAKVSENEDVKPEINWN